MSRSSLCPSIHYYEIYQWYTECVDLAPFPLLSSRLHKHVSPPLRSLTVQRTHRSRDGFGPCCLGPRHGDHTRPLVATGQGEWGEEGRGLPDMQAIAQAIETPQERVVRLMNSAALSADARALGLVDAASSAKSQVRLSAIVGELREMCIDESSTDPSREIVMQRLEEFQRRRSQEIAVNHLAEGFATHNTEAIHLGLRSMPADSIWRYAAESFLMAQSSNLTHDRRQELNGLLEKHQSMLHSLMEDVQKMDFGKSRHARLILDLEEATRHNATLQAALEERGNELNAWKACEVQQRQHIQDLQMQLEREREKNHRAQEKINHLSWAGQHPDQRKLVQALQQEVEDLRARSSATKRNADAQVTTARKMSEQTLQRTVASLKWQIKVAESESQLKAEQAWRGRVQSMEIKLQKLQLKADDLDLQRVAAEGALVDAAGQISTLQRQLRRQMRGEASGNHDEILKNIGQSLKMLKARADRQLDKEASSSRSPLDLSLPAGNSPSKTSNSMHNSTRAAGSAEGDTGNSDASRSTPQKLPKLGTSYGQIYRSKAGGRNSDE